MYYQFNPESKPVYDEISQKVDVERGSATDTAKDLLIVAIDFGTTFSSVAYTTVPGNLQFERADIAEVKCIYNYPGCELPSGSHNIRQDVPTELWYDDSGTAKQTTGEATIHQHLNDGNDSDSSESSSDEGADEPTTQYWGFSVQQRLNLLNIPQDDAQPLTRFKLGLSRKMEAKDKTNQHSLIKRGLIEKETDIYTNFLTHLLTHTKDELFQAQKLHKNMLVRCVLCVPATWLASACETMRNALGEAIIESGLYQQGGGSIYEIFMVPEPEAATACILAETGTVLHTEEAVVILDAGGETVDAMTYIRTKDELRSASEDVVPESRPCGASHINKQFQKKLLQKLASEDYLEENGITLNSIVQTATICFENQHKRLYGVGETYSEKVISIPYLKQDKAKGFQQNGIVLKERNMRRFFRPSLRGAADALISQLEKADEEGIFAEKVLLAGGFGQSLSLQHSLRECLLNTSNQLGRHIELIVSGDPSTAVARGAVLLALKPKQFWEVNSDS